VEVGNQQDRAEHRAEQRDIAPRAHHRAIIPAAREVGNGGNDLRGPGDAAHQKVDDDLPAVGGFFERGPPVVGFASVGLRFARCGAPLDVPAVWGALRFGLGHGMSPLSDG
jgi:hypothetical protein